MKNCIIRISVLLLLIAGTLNLNAGNPVKGRITDSASGSPVEGVSIRIAGSGQGAISNHSGNFSLILENGAHTLVFSHISYKPQELAIVAGDKNEFIEVSLDPGLIGLDEVSVISTYARERETPIAATTIRKATIERESAGQEYPEIMKMTQGVYATRLGGGTGDARISIRGFQQENLGLLLNGIPVSSVENGLVYWSNWAGLGEATQSIQLQRGLGASRVALNSVGGTINIITRTTDAHEGGSLRYDLSGYGNRKATFSVSTGKLDNNIAITFLGSRTSGPGYVDATHVDSWAWFLSVSKTINAKHMLVFTGL
ncbi:MAG TPA: TonB-dependent receptor, partial [Lentimicrobium sp.]|nr:TonB-dependent receptor [Lentimicrobium sp.]